jgi:hypothetical protein
VCDLLATVLARPLRNPIYLLSGAAQPVVLLSMRRFKTSVARMHRCGVACPRYLPIDIAGPPASMGCAMYGTPPPPLPPPLFCIVNGGPPGSGDCPLSPLEWLGPAASADDGGAAPRGGAGNCTVNAWPGCRPGGTVTWNSCELWLTGITCPATAPAGTVTIIGGDAAPHAIGGGCGGCCCCCLVRSSCLRNASALTGEFGMSIT